VSATCPQCGMKLKPGEPCPRPGCGKALGMTSADRRRAEFDSLPPCYGCAGTGLTSNGGRNYGACVCARGKWMMANGEIFRPQDRQPTSDYQPVTEYHPELVARKETMFPADPTMPRKQRNARLRTRGGLRGFPTCPSESQLQDQRNRQVEELGEWFRQQGDVKKRAAGDTA